MTPEHNVMKSPGWKKSEELVTREAVVDNINVRLMGKQLLHPRCRRGSWANIYLHDVCQCSSSIRFSPQVSIVRVPCRVPPLSCLLALPGTPLSSDDAEALSTTEFFICSDSSDRGQPERIEMNWRTKRRES